MYYAFDIVMPLTFTSTLETLRPVMDSTALWMTVWTFRAISTTECP